MAGVNWPPEQVASDTAADPHQKLGQACRLHTWKHITSITNTRRGQSRVLLPPKIVILPTWAQELQRILHIHRGPVRPSQSDLQLKKNYFVKKPDQLHGLLRLDRNRPVDTLDKLGNGSLVLGQVVPVPEETGR